MVNIHIYACKMWSTTQDEENLLNFERKVLRKTYVTVINEITGQYKKRNNRFGSTVSET